ncbi:MULTISPECIES: S-layer homology domain-containing protein [Bacillus]|uniref:S-layer homology domain-containing protein n=1 Tax=Bacillus TaxID=1386 RepID=UPI0002DBD385|nr:MULTISPECIES: S-layer homology domain-containing protein [Bacillus]
MKRVFRQFWSLALVLALLVGLYSAPASAKETNLVNYLSLGDSLAEGMDQNGVVAGKKGFSDYTAEVLKEKKVLGSYSKEFAKSGYMTTQVLADLKSKENLQEAIKKADVISISAGANDFLSLAKFNSETKMLEIDQTKILPKLSEIVTNYTAILNTIKELNKDAKIYVMGYYFPYPFLNDSQKPEIIKLAKGLNSTISGVAVTNDVNFVEVYSKFGDEPKEFVPNPLNIHPNEKGYKTMADALLAEIVKQLPVESIKVTDIEKHWAKKELQYLVNHKMLSVDKNGKVNPNKEITRSEVASILYQTLGETSFDPINPGFKDIPKTHPSYKAIAVLTEKEIFTKDTKFNPNNSLQRVQLAKVVAASYNLEAVDNPVVFKDAPASYWGYPYVQAVATNKIMLGGTNGKFDLYGKVTRAQFAAVVVRALDHK